jgi:hypothetical protein
VVLVDKAETREQEGAGMVDTTRHQWGSELPPGAGSVQLTVHFDVFTERRGGSAVTFSVPEGSELLAKYGGAGRVLAACRDVIIQDLDFLIREFQDEESTNAPGSV